MANLREYAQQLATAPKKGRSPRECACGCGKITKGGTWLPGHDARRQGAQKRPKAAKSSTRLITVLDPSEVAPPLERIGEMATLAAESLRKLTAGGLTGLEVFRKMKFEPAGWHPLDDPARPLNLIEQVNQMWTCMVCINALPFLFARHPDAGGFQLNLGAQSGTDILSVQPDAVAAEGFAAANLDNNKKLKKDLKKLAREHPNAKARYVFFTAPGVKRGRLNAREEYGIEVWCVDV